ncbi:MAG: RtcB family protein [Gammaproteobacteria bacterium]
MEIMKGENALIKSWTDGVSFDSNARDQVKRVASLPFIHSHVAVMPDVHWGMGATVGSVIPTKNAIIPAAVGVDIGCGMVAARTSLSASDLPDSLKAIRSNIERDVPVGRGAHRGLARHVDASTLTGLDQLIEKHPALTSRGNKSLVKKAGNQCGTLGGGNHFIELCLDTENRVWVMLHSGSRGVGNMIGRYFIEVAKEDMRIHEVNLPDKDLSYLSEGTINFDDYVTALDWAQNYARANRDTMMKLVLDVLHRHLGDFTIENQAINCHHT